jgi:hypothetical protein
VAFVASAISLVVRWRRSGQRERRQLRWLLFAVAMIAIAFVLDAVLIRRPSARFWPLPRWRCCRRSRCGDRP